jgi:thiol:disulfide interchange protein DsbG
MKRSIISFFVFLLLVSPVFAQDKKDAAPIVVAPVVSAPAAVAPTPAPPPSPTAPVPDTSNIVFMQNLRKIGASIYYLGETLGLHGWFVVKDGQVQILYSTPDQKALLVGALLSSDGANLSQQQVMVLANNNPEIQKILKNSASLGNAPKVVDAAPAPTTAPDAASDISPSEKFYDALLHAANLTFGKDGTPQIVMIMDVNCGHCHNTWKALQPMVDTGKLRVTMVPITALGPQSEAEGANWLSKADPYDAWKKHVAGDETIFKTGAVNPDKQKAMADNTMLIRKWGVDQTPYLLYHGKNGKIRLVVGEPKKIDVILNDIGN